MKSEKVPLETKEVAPDTERRHLNEGVKPIFACIGIGEDFRDQLSRATHPFDIDNPAHGENIDDVNYFSLPDGPKIKGMKNNGPRSYVISEVNDHNKFSDKIWQCTALVATGIDKITGANISMMSHQDPYSFLRNGTERFIKDLAQSMQELKSRCREGTIDAVIAGGSFLGGGVVDERKQYMDLIKLIDQQVRSNLGFEPLVIVGPKTTEGYDSIFYDSANRRLYLILPDAMLNQPSSKSFKPRDIEKESRKWQEPRSS